VPGALSAVPEPRKEFVPLGLAQPSGRPPAAPDPDRAGLVKRLKADPALRFSEIGRTLLRLLNVHTISMEEWDQIIDKVERCYGRIYMSAGRHT